MVQREFTCMKMARSCMVACSSRIVIQAVRIPGEITGKLISVPRTKDWRLANFSTSTSHRATKCQVDFRKLVCAELPMLDRGIFPLLFVNLASADAGIKICAVSFYPTTQGLRFWL